MYRHLFFLLILGFVYKIDCGDWIEPSNNQNKWANETGSVLFEWKYNLGSGDTPSNVAVQCGYFKGTDLQTVVQKVGHTNPLGRTNDAMSSRVDVFTRNEDPGYVAFRLRSVQKSDEYAYQCTLNTPLSKQSKRYTLKVLKRPEFKTFSVNPTSVEAEKAITINVVTSGNPVPRLICYLMSTSGNEIDRLPRSGRTSNITQKTFLVTKLSKEVLCIATGERTGPVNDTRQLNVISKPFKVKNLAQVESSVDSSVTVRWLHIPSNETGDPSQGESFLLRYELVWWDKSIGRIQNQTIKDLGLPGTLEQNRYYYKRDGYVYYTLRDLDIKSQYGIVVYGVNRLGKGEETNVNTDFRPKNAASKTDDGDNMIGIVIGAVLGGIIVLVLVIVFIVWCSKRSDASKRYPASYVEEAVDYPPNQGHSLYAGVEKKQKVVSRSDSTSGYPDVVGNGNDYSMKPRNSSSYEPSNKAFV
ncbi:uncharacterized protein LOC130636428 [Hydractinia symbiolongicarpus]|uniref:uncharacterized protein LOC130636428 n=1 Tax=Hydractinia symbiolongicarpus TaxID=13093 RepID=UPI0025516A54|nr:uncharacterized protein LOC130636428 [Hydractinia symbiolongicarpus]